MSLKLVFLAILIGGLFLGCAQEQTGTPTPTMTPMETPEETPTATPSPPSTMTPTSTPTMTSTPTPTTTSTPANEVEITIMDFAFNPGSITVDVGTTVVWTNEDSVTHTVTSDAGLFDSGNVAGGESFSYTFEEEGTYRYKCTIHPSMTGEVIVGNPGGGTNEDMNGGTGGGLY